MKKGLYLLFLQFVFLSCVTTAHGASLYMDPNQAELKRGDTIKVSVRLDTDEDECVNAVDGVITYTENIQPVDISRGNSIFSMWVEEPVINRDNRTITFAGGIPNGYCGRIPGDPRLTNNIVDLVFQSPGLQIGSTESGNEVLIDFSKDTQVFLNDGFGTVVESALYGTKIQLSKDAGNEIVNPWQDIIIGDDFLPEKFSVALERTTNAFGNEYFITFNTTDKQSGIDHYEVIEEPLDSKNLFRWGEETAPWVEAKSPYILDDQSLNSTIRVKAIDKAGNEYIAILVPDEAKRSLSSANLINYIALGVLALLLISFLTFAVLFLLKRRSRKNSTPMTIPDVEIK